MPLGELQENLHLRKSMPLIWLIGGGIKDGRKISIGRLTAITSGRPLFGN
jgi:hypothetical protein